MGNKKTETTKTEAAPSEALVPAAAPLATTSAGGALAAAPFNEYGEDAGAGLRELAANEKSIPFLNLLQNNSPEVEEKLVQGAEAGMFINSVSKELISGETGLIIQPVFVQRVFVEWGDRDKGDKGIYGRHLYTSPEVQEAIDRNKGSHISTKDNPLKMGDHLLVDTRYLYVNILDEEGKEVVGYAVLSGAKSKVKPVQDFYSAIDQIRGNPPMWCARARLTSFNDKQKKTGKLFKNFAFRPIVQGLTYAQTLLRGNLNPAQEPWEKALYAKGKKFMESINSGKMQADFDTEGFEREESEAAAEKRHF